MRTIKEINADIKKQISEKLFEKIDPLLTEILKYSIIRTSIEGLLSDCNIQDIRNVLNEIEAENKESEEREKNELKKNDDEFEYNENEDEDE